MEGGDEGEWPDAAPPPAPQTVFVGNLPYDLDEGGLAGVFQNKGCKVRKGCEF